jgi:ketosteroid isomerase-like protein
MQCLRILAAPPMLAAFLVACAPSAPAPLAFSQSAADASNKAVVDRNYKALAEMYTEDAKLMPPHEPVIEGRPAIREYLHDLFIEQRAPAELDQREVFVAGDYAYRDGILTQPTGNGNAEIGKFVQIWKYSDGAWKLHRTIWNLSGAESPATPDAQPAAGAPKPPS